MRKLFYITLILFSMTARAGVTKGTDGGHGVLCSDRTYFPPQLAIELLDFFQMTTVYGEKSLFAETSATTGSDHFDSLVCDYLKNSEARMNKYLTESRVHSAFKEACELSKSVEFSFKDDNLSVGALNVKLPSNCRLVQVAKIDQTKTPAVITVNSLFSDSLTSREYSALLLHEALHKHFVNHPLIRGVVAYTVAADWYQRSKADSLKRMLEAN